MRLLDARNVRASATLQYGNEKRLESRTTSRFFWYFARGAEPGSSLVPGRGHPAGDGLAWAMRFSSRARPAIAAFALGLGVGSAGAAEKSSAPTPVTRSLADKGAAARPRGDIKGEASGKGGSAKAAPAKSEKGPTEKGVGHQAAVSARAASRQICAE